MTGAEILSRIYRAIEQIRNDGRGFGKIELIVRDGIVKHVNVSFEIQPDRPTNTDEEKERQT